MAKDCDFCYRAAVLYCDECASRACMKCARWLDDKWICRWHGKNWDELSLSGCGNDNERPNRGEDAHDRAEVEGALGRDSADEFEIARFADAREGPLAPV